MVNEGNCRSKILLHLQRRGKPLPLCEIFAAASVGEFQGLDGADLERLKIEDLELVKTRTDEEGSVALGLHLPNMVGSIRVVAGTEREKVATAVEKAPSHGRKPPKDVGWAEILLTADKPAKVTLGTDETEMVADGISAITISALVTDRFGNPVEGEAISFESDLGTVSYEGANGLTDETGRVSATISSQKVGTANIRAANRYKSWIEDFIPGSESKGAPSAGGSRSNGHLGRVDPKNGQVLKAETRVRFVPSTASSLIVSVEKPVVAADGQSKARVCAELKDEFGNPVQDERIQFDSDLGEIKPDAEVETDADGKACVFLASGQVGSASIRARTLGEEALLSATQLVFEAGLPADVAISADPDVAIADGESEFHIEAEVKDRMGNPVPGRPITFESDLGSLVPEAIRTTDGHGRADLRMTSRVAGRAHVTATCDKAEGALDIEFKPGKTASVSLSLNPRTEEGWKSRVSPDHWAQLQRALEHLEERRFVKAIEILEKEEAECQLTSNLAALCDLAYAYQQAGRKTDAQRVYDYIVKGDSGRREIRIAGDGFEEVLDVALPQVDGNGSPIADFISLVPGDYLISVALTDDNGNQVSGLRIGFEANFGWIPDELKEARTNAMGVASSMVTIFTSPGTSEHEFAWINLGLMKENALDYQGAEECYRQAIRALPESTKALESLASVLVKTGNQDEAKRCFHNLGQFFSKKGQLSKAIDCYGKAIELDPKYARALAAYGAACIRLGDANRARSYLEESVKIDGSMKSALANLGLLYYLMGEFDKAASMNRRALRIDPKFKPALANLQRIYTAKGDRPRAGKYTAGIEKTRK